MNCAEKLLEQTIPPPLPTHQATTKPRPESPWRMRDLSPTGI